MVHKLLAGITVSLFKLLKTDTCRTRLRRRVCPALLQITSWEEIMSVSSRFYLFSFSLLKHHPVAK